MDLGSLFNRQLSQPCVKHRLPGRLRLQLPLLTHGADRFAPFRHQLEAVLSLPPAVNSVQIDFRSGSILLQYDHLQVSEDVLLAYVERLLRWLLQHRSLLLSCGDAIGTLFQRMEQHIEASLTPSLEFEERLVDDVRT